MIYPIKYSDIYLHNVVYKYTILELKDRENFGNRYFMKTIRSFFTVSVAH